MFMALQSEISQCVSCTFCQDFQNYFQEIYVITLIEFELRLNTLVFFIF